MSTYTIAVIFVADNEIAVAISKLCGTIMSSSISSTQKYVVYVHQVSRHGANIMWSIMSSSISSTQGICRYFLATKAASWLWFGM